MAAPDRYSLARDRLKIPNALVGNAGRRLITIDPTARLIRAAPAFDRPETLLIIVRDEAGVMLGVVSRSDIVAGISHCAGCSRTEAVETAMTTNVQTCAPLEPVDDISTGINQTGFLHIPVNEAHGVRSACFPPRNVTETLREEREHEEGFSMNSVIGIG